MKLIRGKKIANEILKEIRLAIREKNLKPCLAVILVGQNKSSMLYVRLKTEAARKVGIKMIVYNFRTKARTGQIAKLIKKINKNCEINAVIIQLPLPPGLNTNKLVGLIDPQKDADGFHPVNIKKLLAGKPLINPPFPEAILKLIESVNRKPAQKKAVIICKSEIFGRVLKAVLERRKIRSRTLLVSDFQKNVKLVGKADIVITAVGIPGLIKGEMVKKGAIIIDGGITRRKRQTLGDVDFNSVVKVAAYLSPVPGGVGPVTTACLLKNVYILTLKQKSGKV